MAVLKIPVAITTCDEHIDRLSGIVNGLSLPLGHPLKLELAVAHQVRAALMRMQSSLPRS